MKTAEEMFQFCYGTPPKERMDDDLINDFKLIEQILDEDEEVLITFRASLNYKSIFENDGFYSFAITDKRIILARDLWIDKKIKIFSLDEISNVRAYIHVDDYPEAIFSTPTGEVQIHFWDYGDNDIAKKIPKVIFSLKMKKIFS